MAGRQDHIANVSPLGKGKDQPLNEWPTADRDQRFRPIVRDPLKATAEPTTQDDGLAQFTAVHSSQIIDAAWERLLATLQGTELNDFDLPSGFMRIPSQPAASAACMSEIWSPTMTASASRNPSSSAARNKRPGAGLRQ